MLESDQSESPLQATFGATKYRYDAEIARLRRELEARGGSAAVIAGPGPVPGVGASSPQPLLRSGLEPDRPAYPRPELPGALPGGPPPLNGDVSRGE